MKLLPHLRGKKVFKEPSTASRFLHRSLLETFFRGLPMNKITHNSLIAKSHFEFG
ncbi:protein of unknown function [Pseudodesulfovibrio piezophilus C1TLV30]|uniref:Uncharacterized protein n=1 Tax=Pseudodesulfovibrio piezophilus (strain DSM 21447 / JCM 15486 / C1TLV30) TaxID=1322246 RepID=M1WLS7_PSEP2|nr:protein of unknown function [Pseudodesulfovibrio piezophilus C1TLV30]